MRYLVLILIVGAVAIVAIKQSRARYAYNTYAYNTLWFHEVPAVEVHAGVVAPRVVIQKPTITKKTKRAPNTEAVYTFPITGTSDTPEKAKKDAIDLAAAYIASSLELKQSRPDPRSLEKLIADEREGSEGFLGESDAKEFGDGKQVQLTFEVPTDYIRQLLRIERGFRMEDRMGWLARGLAVIVAGLFAISGYVRLDEWSKGYCSGLLKAIAIFAVLASIVGVYYLR